VTPTSIVCQKGAESAPAGVFPRLACEGADDAFQSNLRFAIEIDKPDGDTLYAIDIDDFSRERHSLAIDTNLHGKAFARVCGDRRVEKTAVFTEVYDPHVTPPGGSGIRAIERSNDPSRASSLL
jgi:hypothetical protein